MKKRPGVQSLRFDLIFDLSLLTFCALILSQGLLIVFLRIDVPESWEPVAGSFLRSLHQSFLNSKILEEGLKGETSISAPLLETNFQNFLTAEHFGEGWAHVTLKPVLGQLEEQNVLKAVERPYMFFWKTRTSYQLALDGLSGWKFVYEWSLEPFQLSLTQFKYRVLFVTLLIEILLVLLGYWLLFRRNILVPIDNLAAVSKAFLQENWAARCTIERDDELGDVAGALNEMAEKIQEKEKKLTLTIESLKRANEEIEAQQNEQLQIEKLASIGRLAAGVAHEVGNPLGAISGYIDILRRSMKKSGATAEDIDLCDRVEAETNRISKIIRALLQQARPPKDRIRSVIVKPVVVRSLQLAQVPSTIDVALDFEDDAAEVLAEEDQLVQIFLNLLVNARQSIESREDRKEQGRLTIRCRARKLPIYRERVHSEGDFDTSVVRALKPETYWVVTIEDNGLGISETDQKKLFEPFFSTKAPGKGTGLGLYVTKSIVESFRGALVVRSAPGFGAAFSIFLPRGKAAGQFDVFS